METQTLALIVLFPAIGALLNGLFGRRFGERGVAFVACFASGLALIYSCMAVRELVLLDGRTLIDQIGNWIAILPENGNWKFDAKLNLALDNLSATLLLVVTGVGFLIHLYSVGYMEGDPSFHRYFSYLNLFLTAMLILVLADNMVLMFVGWEGVGLASYLLIGFWFKDTANAAAGKKAFITNRVGDFAFLLGIFLLINGVGSVNFHRLDFAFSQVTSPMSVAAMTAAGLLLFIGACGKSAQIPLHVWLPDAMAGPTPVSALIHAATMVTAGVYMVGRMGALYACAPVALEVIAVVGATTALFAATIGMVQNDIKKVLAYSTISQLGYMFVGMGVGPDGYGSGILHLVTHAFFKALLFLGAGAIIHALHHEQDMRNMGGLRKKMPVVFWCFVVGGLALAGVPPFAGFWSKDAILHHTLEAAIAGHGMGRIAYSVAFVFGLAAAVLTAFYVTRMIAMTFFGAARGEAVSHAHDTKGPMRLALLVLFVLSIVGGVVLAPVWEEWLTQPFAEARMALERSGNAHHHDTDSAGAIQLLVMGLSVAAAVLGIAVGASFHIARPGSAAAWVAAAPVRQRAHRLLENKYWIDELYQRWIVDKVDALSRFSFRIVDRIIIDRSIDDIGRGTRQFGLLSTAVQSGNLSRYARVFAFGGLLVIILALAGGN